MRWVTWVLSAPVLAVGGWMVFDGARALLVGDYVTPKQGDHAGRLGPWANLVSAVGLQPRSTAVKLIFVVYGLCYLAALAVFLLGVPGSWWALLITALAGLWYLPIGTVANLVVVALLVLVPALRNGG
ncbi:MAG TPA: hypothetical protein VFC19_12505 [Candidatus Limnocylindrales bacterium]|nr:hypothetical protein [Candidatus Limnocylindrales bacterium]